MAVTRVRASLTLHGRHAGATAAQVTARLRLEPTSSREVGGQSSWVLDEPASVASIDDPHGMASLDRLAERVADLADDLVALATDYEVRIWMHADSDSEQGGFAIGRETMSRIAATGATFMGGVWLP